MSLRSRSSCHTRGQKSRTIIMMLCSLFICSCLATPLDPNMAKQCHDSWFGISTLAVLCLTCPATTLSPYIFCFVMARILFVCRVSWYLQSMSIWQSVHIEMRVAHLGTTNLGANIFRCLTVYIWTVPRYVHLVDALFRARGCTTVSIRFKEAINPLSAL